MPDDSDARPHNGTARIETARDSLSFHFRVGPSRDPAQSLSARYLVSPDGHTWTLRRTLLDAVDVSHPPCEARVLGVDPMIERGFGRLVVEWSGAAPSTLIHIHPDDGVGGWHPGSSRL